MPEISRDSHPAQPIDSTLLCTVRAMPALSESEHSHCFKEALDTLHQKYCTNGSRHPGWGSRALEVSRKTLVSFADLPKIQTLTPLKSHKTEDFETITGFFASIGACPSLG